MFAPSKIRAGSRAVALALALATSSFSAHAVLERVGPVSSAPSIGGFPTWYQDTTGITLHFCDPQNAAELAGGWCLLLAGNVPSVPEVFPTNFFIEHFYWAGTAILVHQGGGRSKMIIAQEASFANGFNVIPGDQVTFSRIRISLSPVPVTGTYKFIHPYGVEIHQGVAGGRIFFTDDVGLTCKGTFTCSLNSRLGPFLLPSATAGGAEMPALTATNPTPDTNPANFAGAFAPTAYPGTGDAYIADPKRIGPVTGSSLPDFIPLSDTGPLAVAGAPENHNVFRIEGPPGSALGVDPLTGAKVDWIETKNFSLAGRLYSGAIAGDAIFNGASYTRNATGQKVDVFATGLASTVARQPATPASAKVAPTLSFFDAACAGTVDPVTGAILPPFSVPVGATETQMLSTGDQFWGQAGPAVLPSTVCMKNGNARDALGNLVPTFTPYTVTDQVTVTKALYDPTVGTLTVAATSSDATFPPVLTLAYGSHSATLVAGQVVVPSVVAPPANLTVNSSALGSTQFMVSTSSTTGAAAPVANADAFTVLEDSGANTLPVMQNDLNVTGGVLTITTAPTLGTAVVAGGAVTYTPNALTVGADSFTYTVTVGAVSSSATAAVTINPVNHPPVAVADAVNAFVGVPVAINVLANDTDADGVTSTTLGLATGAGLLAGATNISAISPATGATISSAGNGIVNFNATALGTYTFSYFARDNANALSALPATVTVKVIAPETMVLTKAQYTKSKLTLAVQGSINPKQASEVVTLTYINAAGAVVGNIGTTTALNGSINATFNAMPLPPATATRIQATTAPSVNSPTGSVATFPLQIVN